MEMSRKSMLSWPRNTFYLFVANTALPSHLTQVLIYLCLPWEGRRASFTELSLPFLLPFNERQSRSRIQDTDVDIDFQALCEHPS